MIRISPLLALVALSALLLGGGCTSAEEEAAGTYMLDKESAKAAVQAKIDAEADQATKAEMEMALQLIDGMSMQFTLNPDGSATSTVAMMGENQTTTGKWTISGDTVTITMDEAGSEPATGTLTGDTLEMNPPTTDMPFKLIFKKREQ